MRGWLIAATALAACAPVVSGAPALSRKPAPLLAVTVDDLPAHGPLPPGRTRAQVIRTLARAFTRAKVPAFGFFNASFGRSEPDWSQAVAAWRDAGLRLGNHTERHLRLNAVGAKAFLADVDANEGPLAAAAPPDSDWHWFRYPFLNEGGDARTRNAVRAGLRDRGYRIAGVSMSFNDFAWQSAYAACLAARDGPGTERLKRAFLDEARRVGLAARDAPAPHILLLHAGALDADVMPELLRVYRRLGFRFVSLERASADPYWAAATDLSRPGPTPAPYPAALAGPGSAKTGQGCPTGGT